MRIESGERLIKVTSPVKTKTGLEIKYSCPVYAALELASPRSLNSKAKLKQLFEYSIDLIGEKYENMKKRKAELLFCGAVVSLALAGCKSEPLTMIVGTYTDECASRGVYSYFFDQEKGELIVCDKGDRFEEASGAVGRVEMRNPSYLTLSADGKFVYAVSEVPDSSASAVMLGLDTKTGEMQLLGSELTDGKDPCYISTNGKVVMTANYSSGNVTEFPIGDDGRLLPHDFLYETGLGGPDSTRQNLPHAHCALFNAAGTELYVSEFSADAVTRYDVATRHGKRIQLPSDFGPRHIALNGDESKAYVLGELSGDVAVIDTERDSVIQIVCADSVHARGSADIHLSPDGRFLYASNRLQNDGIAIFRVGKDGFLTYAGYQNTGLHPRNFNITPNGKFLLAACRDSGCIQIFRRDARTGLLSDTGRAIALDKPVCIKFW